MRWSNSIELNAHWNFDFLKISAFLYTSSHLLPLFALSFFFTEAKNNRKDHAHFYFKKVTISIIVNNHTHTQKKVFLGKGPRSTYSFMNAIKSGKVEYQFVNTGFGQNSQSREKTW